MPFEGTSGSAQAGQRVTFSDEQLEQAFFQFCTNNAIAVTQAAWSAFIGARFSTVGDATDRALLRGFFINAVKFNT